MNKAEPTAFLVNKAKPIGDQFIPNTHIEIAGETPEGLDYISLRSYMDEQAKELEKTLYNALPGGTYDLLFAHMAKRKASSLLVSYSSL